MNTSKDYLPAYDQTHQSPLYSPIDDPEIGTQPNVIGAKIIDCTMEVRLAFVRKVYTILTFQLFVTAVMSSMIYGIKSLREFAQQSLAMLITAAVLSIVLVCATIAFRRKHPLNLYLLLAFTFCIGYTTGVATSFYSATVVLQAVLITLFVFLGLTLFTLNSKRDFSGMGPFLHVGLLVLVFTGLIQLIMAPIVGFSSWFNVLIAGASSLLFSFYIVYDTYMIFNKLSVEEYVVAAIELYLDVINLFLNILRIIGYFSGNGHNN